MTTTSYAERRTRFIRALSGEHASMEARKVARLLFELREAILVWMGDLERRKRDDPSWLAGATMLTVLPGKLLETVVVVLSIVPVWVDRGEGIRQRGLAIVKASLRAIEYTSQMASLTVDVVKDLRPLVSRQAAADKEKVH